MAEHNGYHLGRVAELDGIRAFAVVAVMCDHSYVAQVPGGALGVDVFFALSGYLITSILLREWDRFGRIRLGQFYQRRALRLLPAFLAVTIACCIYCETIGPGWLAAQTLPALPYEWAYLSNWHIVFTWTPGGGGMLGTTWTLSVEEQFYLLWPIALILCLRRGTTRIRLARAAASITVLEFIWRTIIVDAHLFPHLYDYTYYSSDTHSGGLFLGCALALWLSTNPPPLRYPRLIASFGAALLIAMFTGCLGIDGYAREGSYDVAALATLMVIVGVIQGPGGVASRVLSMRPLSYIGRISYGIYLWHFPIYLALASTIFFSTHAGWYWIAKWTVPFAVAAFSYRFLERPFLRLKDLRSRADTPPALAAVGDG